MLKGILHIHSNFSYDGENSVFEWASFLEYKKYSFVCFTEHDDDFDQHKMIRLIKACEEVSTPTFCAIPGLEFRCSDRVHILGIGVTEYCRIDDPIKAAGFIREAGGLSVIAHPRGYEKNITKVLLEIVDGIEIWNGSKDGRFFPRADIVQFYQKCREVNSSLIGIGGSDTHNINSFFQLDTYVKHNSVLRNNLNIFKAGDIKKISGKYYAINCKEINAMLTTIRLKILSFLYDNLKFLKDRAINLLN